MACCGSVFLAVVALVTYFLYSKKKTLHRISKTYKRDFKLLKTTISSLIVFKWWTLQNLTVPKLLQKWSKRNPDKVAFYCEDKVWTFKRVEEYSNKIANAFKQLGYKRGDCVALMLDASPEYVCLWVGLAKIGVRTGLLNTNIVLEALEHSIEIINCKGIIYGPRFQQSINDIKPNLSNIEKYYFEENLNFKSEDINLFQKIEEASDKPPQSDIDEGNIEDILIYVYTSGTTGLPKAAPMRNTRYMYMSLGIHNGSSLNQNDIIYVSLPLYHGSGGIIGVGQTLVCNITGVIRKKFSARNFFLDCKKYQCTAAMYIGEICRYILAAHEAGEPIPNHWVRKMIGNGLNAQVWTKFCTKLHVEEIKEFFGSTEGNVAMINVDNRVGAIGSVPLFAQNVLPYFTVKCDKQTGEPLRNSEGFCEKCADNEVGVLLARTRMSLVSMKYSGYVDEKASKQKLLKDVFVKGDEYFNTGDLLVRDELGYYYFRDRTGDTFRWKGENVSTTEVENIISKVVDFKDALVYGVQIPGSEGRAGMVTIVDTNDSLDISNLYNLFKNNLPTYAVPIFVRVSRQQKLTGTYKLKKTDIHKEGFDINQIKDDVVYIQDQKEGKYVELTKELYDQLLKGSLTF